MPVQELVKFRAKYPDYNDIDDATLASKLAAKYPDAYGDLPSKVKIPTALDSDKTVKPVSAVPENWDERFIAGMGGGMMHLAEGLKQRSMEAGSKLGIVSPEEVQEYQNYIDYTRKIDKPLMDTTWGKIGEFVGQAVPTAPIPGGVQGRLATRIGTGMLAGATMGIFQPTTTDEEPMFNAALGATGGGVGVGTGAALSKGINIAKGPVKNATQQLADKFGIRATLGEITQNPIIQKAETWLEGVPFIGLGRFRKKQQVDAENSAKNFLSKYIVNPDAPDAMQANRAYAGSLYEDLKMTVNGIPNQKIDPSETRQAAGALIDRYPDIFKKFQDTKRESIIRNVIGDTQEWGMGSQRASSMVAPNPVSFDDIWILRDGLGEMIGQARRKLASGEVDQTTISQLKQLFGAVNNDIDNWANSIGRPDVRTAINSANDAYKQYVVKYDVIQRAMDKAQGVVGSGEMFSPKKLSTELKRISYKDKVFHTFRPDEIQEMTGLANIMQVVKRAGQYAENPPTGNRWGLPVIATALGSQSIPAGAGIVTATGLSTFLTSTRIGKAIALSASRLEPNSPQMSRLLNTAYQQAAKLPALGLVKEFGQTE